MIYSPIASGNGAHVVHKLLEQNIRDYSVKSFNPYLTLFPVLLSKYRPRDPKALVHTTPDYAVFHLHRQSKLIVTFHGYPLDSFMHAYSSFMQTIHYRTDLRWFTRMAIKRAAVLTSVSYFTAELVRSDLGIEREIRVIYNGIDEMCFIPPTKRIGKRSIKILFSGNLKKAKGVHWLLPIAERLKKESEILYTQGLRSKTFLPEHPRLRCVGNIPYKDMPDLYRQADILLLPTVREGLPMSVLEAMACGLPVVATDCSSLPELIDQGKGGFLCPLGDVDAFAEKVNLLVDSPGLRREMGEYNRAKVEQYFTLDRMVREYRELFESLR